ncbi:hypothetical protein Tco_0024533 [Tanacetum coccineum]
MSTHLTHLDVNSACKPVIDLFNELVYLGKPERFCSDNPDTKFCKCCGESSLKLNVDSARAEYGKSY